MKFKIVAAAVISTCLLILTAAGKDVAFGRTGAGDFSGVAMEQTPLSSGIKGQEQFWKEAVRPRSWLFPADHGSHPEFRTEWWYFTGHLADAEGREYGYQLTFFRQGIRIVPSAPEISWSLRDVYFGHLALTDVASGRFQYREIISRPGPGLAGSDTGGLRVWILDWSCQMEGDRISLHAEKDDIALNLKLKAMKSPVLHGEGGLSQKGPSAGQASHYASITRLGTEGSIRLSSGSSPVPVSGLSWFDHEFGSNLMADDQAGWDWFSLHLSDDSDLMLYSIRKTDGSVESFSSGTLIQADGTAVHLGKSDFNVEVKDRWRSPQTDARYPSKWKIQAPLYGIDIEISAVFDAQELQTLNRNINYWEGAVRGFGKVLGLDVRCCGYVEMTGYAGNLSGIF